MVKIAHTLPSWNPELLSSSHFQNISQGKIIGDDKEEHMLDEDVRNKFTEVCQTPNQDKESLEGGPNVVDVAASVSKSSPKPNPGHETTRPPTPSATSRIVNLQTLQSVVQQLVQTLRERTDPGSGRSVQNVTREHVLSDTTKVFQGARNRPECPKTSKSCSPTKEVKSSEVVCSDNKLEEESSTSLFISPWAETHDDCVLTKGTGEVTSAIRNKQTTPSNSTQHTTNIHKCPECGKYFPHSNSLWRHISLHLDERPFQCSQCDANYKTSSQLSQHMRIHTGEKPAKCTYCDKTFRTYDALYVHRRKHTGEKPYKCQYCDKRFSSRGYRNTHERIHTGEKRYECDFCGMRFTESTARRVHRFTHTGEAPYKCKECGKTFTQAGNLGKHTRAVHAKEKSFQV